MTQKQVEILEKVLAGVVADDSPFWSDSDEIDVEKIASDISSKLTKKFKHELYPRHVNEFQNKIASGLLSEGIICDDDTDIIATLKTGKLETIPATLATLLKTKQAAVPQSDSSKTHLENIKAIEKALEEKHQKELNELAAKVKQYEAKEMEAKKDEAIKAALPNGLQLKATQFKAVKSILSDTIDFAVSDNDIQLFHKGTEKPFGLLNEKPTLLTLSDYVPGLLKELGFWSEKPKPQKLDLSSLEKQQNKSTEVQTLTPLQERLAAAKKLSESK